MPEVFISYSSKDKLAADAAVAVIEEHGISCWVAPRNIRPGSEWGESILEGIEICSIFLLIFSDHANESPQVRREVERAVHKGLIIIPIRLQDVTPRKSLEFFISSAHWMDAFPPPFEAYLDSLTSTLKSILQKTPPPPRAAQAGSSSSKLRTKVYILDDHPLIIEGLKKIIDSQPDMNVVGSAEDANRAFDQIDRLHPDILILDITLKDRSGVDVIKTIRSKRPELQILVYSMHDENIYAERCLCAGAMGYLMKGESSQRVLQGVRQIASGGFSFSANLLGSIVTGGGSRSGSRGEPSRLLSDRQLEVFEMVGHGLDSHKIAEKLGLTAKTVDAHKANIRQKLGLDSARELLMEAVRWVEK